MMQPRGWHSRGYLPHFDSPETIQFVTFRLADSLPRAVAQALGHREDEVHRIERELDACLGARNEAHLAQTIEYVENNPVKAGLARLPADWEWSSARYRAVANA